MGRVTVRAQPGASKNRVVGRFADGWKLAVVAPPVDGKANRALEKALAGWLDIPRGAVTLVTGATSRTKVFEVPELAASEIDRRLEAWTGKGGSG